MMKSASLAIILATATQAFVPGNNVLSNIGTKLSASSSSVEAQDDRRAFLVSAFSTTAAVASIAATATPLPALANGVDYKAVSKDIAALIKADPDKGPTLVRLAWHSSGTYDKMSKDGGSGGGTIRFKEELAHGGNAGLAKTAVKWLEPIHKKYPGLSYADLYTLAGVTAFKELGGPIIGWSSGRVDQPVAAVTPDGRLPNADVGPKLADSSDADHLRQIFGRMGFHDKEIVALSGAHALGRCHENASGFSGPWTFTPTTFNNAYFTLLTSLNWVPKEWKGPPQYVDAGTGKLMMLPTDLVLLQDKKFMKFVTVYAKDEQKFLKDFSKAFQKLNELGTSNLTPTEWA
mmetsp:Transcript_22163/g.33614  ORF Transcript_22163/g.33614 Transcript_22163/m.33614 type:complete len:347 (+) Transcript_22163:36-1076(+)